VTTPVPARACEGCGAELAPALLACPSCRRLVHGARLTALAREAQAAVERGELSQGAAHWRSALALLPAEAAQHAQVQERVTALSARIEREGSGAAPERPGGRRVGGRLGVLGALGLLAWKLKAFVLLALGKAKLLLFGLTKLSTLLSMAASLGVYWAAWGWKFAAGLVASIYVHEIGHVAALRRYGIAASAPMFVPGLGAFIRSSQYPATPREDARVGLAGPLWGLFAAGACYGAHLATGWESLAAIARVGAWINLFNLLPVATLDGGRGFASFATAQRWLAVALLAALWVATQEGLLLLLCLGGVGRALVGQPAGAADWPAFALYAALAAALSVATLIPVATG
jgi:Zn-dependent protease